MKKSRPSLILLILLTAQMQLLAEVAPKQRIVKVAVVGCGLWGRNIVRNFYNLGALHTVCDIDNENLKKVTAEYSGINLTNDFNEIINNPEITAVAVVVPSHLHYRLVKQ